MKIKKSLLILLIALVSFGTYAQNVLTHAGTPQTKGHNPTMVYRLNAYFDGPHGLAFDSKGNLWISNADGQTISVIYKNDSFVMTRAGAYGYACLKDGDGVTSKLNGPSGIAVGSGDTIYIADRYNHVIRKLHPLVHLYNTQECEIFAGKYSYVNPTDKCYKTYPGFKNGTLSKAQFNEPTDVAIDPSGNIYVADYGNHCIRMIDTKGNVTTYAGQPGTSGNTDGDRVTTAEFSYPFSVEYYNGDLYVTDRGNGRIRKISGTTGKVSTLNIKFPNIWNISNIYIHGNGDMYYSDGSRVMKYDMTNDKVKVFAGTTIPQDTGGFKNDTGTAAKFKTVKALVVDPKNTRYVYAADYGNHVIRRLVICDTYKPDVTITGPTTTCFGDSVILTAEAGFESYLWSTGENTREITIKKQGNYNVTCTVLNQDACYGVSDPVTVDINFLKPKVTPNGPLSFCTGGKVLLVGQAGLDYYKWQKDGNTVLEGAEGVASSFTATESGDYVLIGTSGPCTGSSSAMKVRISDHITPSVNVTYGDTNLCEGEAVKLQTASPYSSYQWKKDGSNITDATSREHTISQPGKYSVYVVDNNTSCNGESYPVSVVSKPSPDKPTITENGDSMISSSKTNNQWYYYGSVIPGATDQIYVTSTKGYYKVEVTNSEGCSKFSDEINHLNTSIDDDIISGLKLYPNPAIDKLNISASYISSGKVTITVSDILGHQVFFDEEMHTASYYSKSIDLNGLKRGIYIVRVSINHSQLINKIVLE